MIGTGLETSGFLGAKGFAGLNSQLLKFSGIHTGDAGPGAKVTYVGDWHDYGGGPNAVLAYGYPVSACQLAKLRVDATINACIADVVVEVYKNGVATGLKVTIPAGFTGIKTDLVDTALFADNDTLDLVSTSTAAGNNSLLYSATVETVPVGTTQLVSRQYDFTFDSFQTDGTTNELFAQETAFDFDDFSSVNIFARLCTQAYVDGASIGTVRIRYGGTSGLPDGTLLVSSANIVSLVSVLASANNIVAKPAGPQLIKLTVQNDTVGKKTILDAGSVVIREQT